MGDRDDFTERVKRTLCDSVGTLCSRPGCQAFTKGPHSSGEAVTNIGVACHIHAAAVGGPRYRADQTSDERKSATNGIWLCQNDGKEVDSDEVRFPADLLRQWKAAAEAYARANLGRSRDAPPSASDGLVALGPHVIARGRVVRTEGTRWRIVLRVPFLLGDVAELRRYGDTFLELPPSDCFICVEHDGAGRLLAEPPIVEYEREVTVDVHVAAPLPRREAATSAAGKIAALRDVAIDLERMEVDFDAEVRGLDAIPQMLMMCLSDNGPLDSTESRVPSFHRRFGTSDLESLIAIELIRFATVPQADEWQKRSYVLLPFIERVRSARILGPLKRPSSEDSDEWIKVRLALELYGAGTWERDIPVCVVWRRGDDGEPLDPKAFLERTLEELLRAAKAP